MQKLNVTKCFFLFFIISFLITNVHAAVLLDVWNHPKDLPILNQFYFNNHANDFDAAQKNTYFFTSAVKALGLQQFKAMKVDYIGKESHVRYVQYFQGIPVWGPQLIVHHKNETKVTGTIVTHIENDITSVAPVITGEKAQQIAYANLQKEHVHHQLSASRLIKNHLVIYLDNVHAQTEEVKAKVAYVVTFFADDVSANRLLRPVYFIDARNGSILKKYDNIQTQLAVGTGPGGNDITGLSMRATNHYQFGTAIGGLPSFGPLPVEVNNTVCTMITPQVRLSSYRNVTGTGDNFPITYAQAAGYPVFNYTCTENLNDGGYAPIDNNGFLAYSPSNDSFYFAQAMYTLMQTYIPEVANPWGRSLPIRIYTHVGNFDNAIAISPSIDIVENFNHSPAFNAQFVVGNGYVDFYPLSDAGTVGHELTHIFTAFHSRLIYENQSGAIDEAYSDIAGQTLEFYLSQLFPFYGFNWEIGASICLPSGPYAGKALRYMNNPPLDGHSIKNANEFMPGLDVHYGSGVYNFAFYLLVTKYNVNIFTAYKYFSHANAAYWKPDSGYDNASCGVMQAALDLGNHGDFNKIAAAFREVGVRCKIGVSELLKPI